MSNSNRLKFGSCSKEKHVCPLQNIWDIRGFTLGQQHSMRSPVVRSLGSVNYPTWTRRSSPFQYQDLTVSGVKQHNETTKPWQIRPRQRELTERSRTSLTFCLSRIFMAKNSLVPLCCTSMTRPKDPVPRVLIRSKSSNEAVFWQNTRVPTDATVNKFKHEQTRT